LGEAGIEAKPAVTALAATLKDTIPAVKVAAAKTLAGLGPEAAPAVANLALLMRDPDEMVRKTAAEALGEIGEAAVTPLVEAVKDKDSAVRLAAILTLDTLNFSSELVGKALGEAAKDNHATVKRVALVALAKLGEEAKDYIPVVVAALKDKDAAVRNTAAYALTNLGNAAVPEFQKILAKKDNPAALRMVAVQILGKLGEEMDETSAGLLRECFRDSDIKVRQIAVWSIANLGSKARDLAGGAAVVKDFIKLMKDKDLSIRQFAVTALGKIGLDEKDDLAALADGLKDANLYVRGLTIEALSQYSHDQAPEDWRKLVLQSITGALKDRDPRVQQVAAKTLIDEGKVAVPELIKVVEKGTGSARFYAAYILGEIGVDAADAVPALQKMSRDSTIDGRQMAKSALSKIMP
jgi:HEAT repeat protein